MSRRFLPCALAAALAFVAAEAGATQRAFAYTQESRVLHVGESEVEPSTTFRLGRERYFHRMDGRLAFEHGFTQALQLALYWNFTSQSRDVVGPTENISRVSESELAGASLEAKYQLSDPSADALGSSLYLETTLGPKATKVEARVILDRQLGKWLVAGNVAAEYELASLRTTEGSDLETALVVEPLLGAAYTLGAGLSAGLELRAPLGLTGEAKSSTLFGGPVLGFAHERVWGALAVQPQLLAFSGQSADSQLDLTHHERVEVRLLVGLVL